MPPKALAALIAAFAAIAVISVLSEQSREQRAETVAAVRTSDEVRERIYKLLATLIDAESGQRGYLLTGIERYLELHDRARGAVPEQLAELGQMVADNPERRAAIASLGAPIAAKLAELAETVALKRAGDEVGALALVRSDRGKALMDRIRSQVDGALDLESRVRATQATATAAAVRWSSYVTFGGIGVVTCMILLIGWYASGDFRAVAAEGWLRRVELTLASQLQGDLRVESLGDKVLGVVVDQLRAQVGAIYVMEPSAGLRRVAGYALVAGAPGAALELGEGLVGEAARRGELVHLRELPTDYLQVSSSVGHSRRRELAILPARVDGTVEAVIELGFLHAVDALELEALRRIGEAVAIAIRTARDRSRLEELLEETRLQSAELQAQQEVLRLSNDELEQQRRALQLSQAQLENQQAELEQINAQLEAQTQSLEVQRDGLARASGELQRSSEYKSQFLANMSHELRTPLNSTLILAKLLGENRPGNLTAEQVKFAQTIYSAGNDLLTLINDILDLSKVEAGMLEVHAEPVELAPLVDELADAFQPVATQRRLAFELTIAPGGPAAIVTDRARLHQILKNLISNAFKFTERGGVSLAIEHAGGEVRFAVRDTGIGIAADQHAAIFEAFRQADGATNRKFGGSGLGLSISRDLAHLLGGELVVASAPGGGSTFTLALPAAARVPGHAGRVVDTAPRAIPPPARAPLADVAPPLEVTRPGPARRVLIVEDDPVLRDSTARLLAGDRVEVVAVGDADEALRALAGAPFDCMVLDLALPDRSGLELLEEMTRGEHEGFPPVIVYTGRALSHHQVHELERLSRSIVLKGARSPERLLDEVTRFLADAEAGPPIAHPQPRGGEPGFDGRRILIAEDDVRNVFALSSALEPLGAVLEIARDGRQAVAAMDAHPDIALVLMDIMMPELDGLEATRLLRADPRFARLPIIAITAKAMIDDREKCLAAGASDYLAKPLDLDQLLAKARLWLQP